jgi:SnoaL-like protein
MVLGEDEADESWRTRIDVAEGAHEPLRDGPDAFDDSCRAGLTIFSSGSGVHTIAISREGSEMAIALPPTIARFIDASNARDLEAAIDCFGQEAVVEDEGRTHRGIAEVRAWKQATEERFRYTIEPTGLEERDGRSLMRGILAGNFPGSPVELTYDFRLVDDTIESLNIHP